MFAHPFQSFSSLAVLTFLGAILPGPANADEYEDKLPAIRQLVSDTMEEAHLNSVILGINAGGKEVLVFAEGESMNGIPATPDMHFRIGAVSIAYMGSILLQLADEGVVSLDDPVGKWLPDLPKADEVTLAMLINGTAGYPDFVPMKSFQDAFYGDVFRQWTPEELIETAFQDELKFPPGTDWNYAHTNFVILGLALEKAAGKPFGTLMRERIMAPFGLDQTANPDTPAVTAPVLHSYTTERGPYEEATSWNPSWTLARGAVMTSDIRDVLKSARAIGTGQGLKPASFQAMLEPRTAGMQIWTDQRYYGLGIVVVNGWLAQNPTFHGYSGVMAYLPEKDLAVAICATTQADAEPDTNFSDLIFRKLTTILSPNHAVE
jgi:D-alanyl-D-alanine carboxypeptidase